ncbi:MAG: tRNA pseudouridine(38-40) synthase TruA [Chloroflexota bacterium]
MMRKFRCTVQYEGTAFAGFQRQPGRLTVQGALESAIARVTRNDSVVVGAGRTDAGVHALGQVIHFTTASPLPPETLRRALNACLPKEVALMDIAEAPDGFHARHSAVSREYRYLVDNGAVRSPLLHGKVYHVSQPLAADAMAEAAAILPGRHDFAAFGSPMEHALQGPHGEATTWRGGTIRTLLTAGCRRVRRFVLFWFMADAFLRRMVRMLVGTLLRIGAGSLQARALGAMLHGDHSIAAGPAAPAHGLYLVRVRY